MSLIAFVTENLSKFPQSKELTISISPLPLDPVIEKCEVILQILMSVSMRSDLRNDDVQVINLAFVGVLNIMYNLRET